MMFDGLGSSATHIKGGRIKALMVSGNKRNPPSPMCRAPPKWACPTTPSPPGTACGRPRARRPMCRPAPSRRSARPAPPTNQSRLGQPGRDFPNLTGAQFGALSGEIRKWAQVVKASGAKLD
jgi:hypothetical protein